MKSKTRIKVCGIRTPEELELAANLGADAVGLLTEVPLESPRKIDSTTAVSLTEALPKGLDSVLVIMPKNAAEALRLIEKVRPDIVQIHSDLSLSELERLNDKADLPVIKALFVPAEPTPALTAGLFTKVRELEVSGVVDAVLLDTGYGTGRVHDWDLSRRVVQESSLPVVLAGGLNPGNVQEAVRAVAPYAVDTASGVETGGKKDALKIKTFIEEVRCANAFL